ncbi:MAG: Papain family cysteine protease [bacterium ADurb.BinA186]|nr:MAG: Papain family cysteine protease [bacterium ADurb.BinA186]
MGKKKILLLFVASLQGWGHDISPLERPPFEQTILTKAAEKRIFSVDDAQRVRDIEAFMVSKPKGKVNLISEMSPAKNQGQRGTCSSFATMGLVEHFIDRNADYSEQCLAYFSASDDGGNIGDKLSFILSQGIYREGDCPYKDPKDFDNWLLANDKEQENLALEARNTIPLLTNIRKLTPAFRVIRKHVDELSDGEYLRYIQNQLDDGIPVGAAMVSIGEEWTKRGMIEKIPGPEQIKKECKDRQKSSALSFSAMPFKKCDSHAVVLTGYDDAKKLIYFKNSWDENWGLDENMNVTSASGERRGYGAFSYAYLTKFRVNSLITLSR